MPNIFATATPEGISGVAVVRLSGPKVLDPLRALTHDIPKPRAARLRTLIDPRDGQVIDTALVLIFAGPASFTGEDVVELHCHGSRAILERLGQILVFLGLRPAEPGEFSRRALQNGKMDLLDVESLDAVLHAKDTAQLQIAQGQSGARRQEMFSRVQTNLVSLMAGCEALIDFPDDDLPEALLLENSTRLDMLLLEVSSLLERSLTAAQVDRGLEILLVGPPNAGKSTLLNTLAGYDRAIVTDIPGTTRDFVELELSLGPFRVILVDTAGLREEASDAIESIGMDRTRSRLSDCALILNLHDLAHLPCLYPLIFHHPSGRLKPRWKRAILGRLALDSLAHLGLRDL